MKTIVRTYRVPERGQEESMKNRKAFQCPDCNKWFVADRRDWKERRRNGVRCSQCMQQSIEDWERIEIIDSET
uniref:Uncharacterized protein n=1 Tax=viral metagenome TaxID=1070528 RepID=A0A6M3IQX9_9ZZZZ